MNYNSKSESTLDTSRFDEMVESMMNDIDQLNENMSEQHSRIMSIRSEQQRYVGDIRKRVEAVFEKRRVNYANKAPKILNSVLREADEKIDNVFSQNAATMNMDLDILSKRADALSNIIIYDPTRPVYWWTRRVVVFLCGRWILHFFIFVGLEPEVPLPPRDEPGSINSSL